jgi:hypothetical protein
MAQTDESADAPAPDAAEPDGEETDGWAILSELDLDVCLTDSAIPGVPVPDRAQAAGRIQG